MYGRYTSAEELRLAVQDIVYGLVFTKEGVEEHEEALAQLGLHIGLPTQRPEKTLAEGPDVFWALSATEYWVIEAKSGSRTQRIHRGDANQLAGSMNWFRTRYGSIATATPVMVHKAHKLADDASATPGMMVLDEQGLQRLKAAAISYAAGLASTRWDNPESGASQLEGQGLRSNDLAAYLRNAVPAH